MKDTIRRRGENISSFEVESAVGAHDAVAECAAYAVPDGFGGDDVMVAVVPVDPARLRSRAQLFAFLEGSMPAYMVPRYVDVIDEIPRNATTLRVQKFVLRERGVTATTWDRTALTDRVIIASGRALARATAARCSRGAPSTGSAAFTRRYRPGPRLVGQDAPTAGQP